ncbi:MAG: 2-succinyl-5-enolpyruvyl-6-hydroxy-3-cyclohexene-1-carboxylic-acid synthase [Actinomycetota bacterium]
MSTADEQARYCADFVSGLADARVTVVFISPGSRSTPLTLAFAAEPRIDDVLMRDERSAGFAALGHGKATGRPAAVVCTSGSAATHYFPSIVEADHAGVPLIVLTADRPARLRGTSAPQTMDQIELYGSHVKTFVDLETHGETGRRDAHGIAAASLALPAGPVHANVPFDEPLVADTPTSPSPRSGWVAPEPPHASRSHELDSLVGRNVFIVAGGRQRAGFPDAVNEVAQKLRAPVISDPQCWVVGPNTVRYADLLAGTAGLLDANAPDVVLRLGPIPTSKPLWTWLEASGVEQILVEQSRFSDPLDSATVTIDQDPTAYLAANIPTSTGDRSFRDAWLALDTAAGAAAVRSLNDLTFPNEPEIARTVASHAAADSVLYVGSSMPIRDVDAFAEPRADITVLSNRGLNGIDGAISSALGVALAGRPVTLLVGDVSALHDATALSELVRLDAPLRVVVVNNDGGGIFSFLPQGSSDVVGDTVFERHWGTPHGLDLSAIGAAFGLDAKVIDNLDDLTTHVSEAITGPSLIEVRTERMTNLDHHRSIRAAVGSALPRILPLG